MEYKKVQGGCFGKEGTLLDRIVECAKNMGPFHLLAVTTVAAELFTLAMNTMNSYLWWGTLSVDLLLIGVVDAFVVSIAVAPAIIFILFRLKETEASAAANAAYLDSILRSSAGMAIVATDTDFKVTLLNPAAEALFGLSADELMGMDVRRLHRDGFVDPARFDAAMETFRRTGRYSFTMERGEGEKRRFIKVVISGIQDRVGGNTGYVMMAEDLTGQITAESSLRESESKFRILVEQSLFGVAIIQDGRYAYVNPIHAAMLGYTQEEMTALGSIMDRVHPDDIEMVRENIRKRMSGEVPSIRYQFRFLKKDGDIVHVEVHGSRAEYKGRPAVISSVLDITERIKAEESISQLNEDLERRVAERTAALIESEHSYRTLAENLPGIVYRVFLREDNRMKFFNNAVQQMAGYACAELEKGEICDIDRLMLSEDRDAVIAEVKAAVGEDRPFLVEYRITRKDGGTSYLQERGRPVRGADGKPLFIDGVILDITGRMKAQRDREEMLARLNDAQKMEAVGTLAGGIAHDFNNLLTVIRGDTELALEITGDQGEAYSCLRQVKKAADRAAELTRKLLLFSRNRHVTPVDMDLNATVTEMVKMLNRLIGENITVSVDLEPEPWTVHAEPSGMEQVIMNLVLNARDAMPDGGIISISTRNVVIGEGANSGAGAGRQGEFVRLSVADTGRGMDEETMKHIFDPFFSRSQGKGTGLGLTVVHGVVKGLGGWTSVDSSPGNGARFDVYLERAETG